MAQWKVLLSDKLGMKSLRPLLLVFGITLSTANAWSFDRVLCEAQLEGWSVHNSMKIEDVVLSKVKKTVELTRQESSMLLLRDEKKEALALISPWNGVHLYPAKSAIKTKYKFNLQTDHETWFNFEITHKKTKQAYTCRLTS